MFSTRRPKPRSTSARPRTSHPASPAQYAPETLEGLRSQIIDQLDRTWKVNFEEILKKRDVVKLVNELEQCIEDAKLRKKRAEASADGGLVEAPVP
jgi:kinetochore protein NNF1